MSSDDWKNLPVNDGWGPWSNTEHLLANISDRIAHLEFALIAVNSEKGRGPTEPTPMDRPGVGAPPWERRELHRLESERVAAYIQYARDHNGAAPPGSWMPDSEVRSDFGRTKDDEGGGLDG